MLETSALKLFNGGQFMSSTQLIILKLPVILSNQHSTSFFRNLPSNIHLTFQLGSHCKLASPAASYVISHSAIHQASQCVCQCVCLSVCPYSANQSSNQARLLASKSVTL